jgi:hypothetical protein
MITGYLTVDQRRAVTAGSPTISGRRANIDLLRQFRDLCLVNGKESGFSRAEMKAETARRDMEAAVKR